MPALDNPRWERFAQAIVEGLANGDRKPYSQGRAYIAAGYTAKDAGKRGGSAEAAASRLLSRVKPVLDRVKELQAETLARIERKLDVSRERVGRRLDMASRKAEDEGNTANIIAAELGIAKVFGLTKAGEGYNPTDPSNAQSMEEIGRLLMQSVGATSPSQAQINLAVEANNAFVERLEAIRDEARDIRSQRMTNKADAAHRMNPVSLILPCVLGVLLGIWLQSALAFWLLG